MDELIVLLQKNDETLPIKCVKEFRQKLASSKGCRRQGLPPAEYGPKAWKILVLLSKRQHFDEAALSLLNVCAFVVELCEERLKIKQFDFDKLLISILVRIKSKDDAKKLAISLNSRITGHLAGTHSCNSRFGLDLECNEMTNSIGVFENRENIDSELLKVVILFQISLLHLDSPSSSFLLASLIYFLQEQSKRDVDVFCKHFQFLARHSIDTAVFVAINSTLDLLLVISLIPKLSDLSLYKYESAQWMSLREFQVACALGLAISANSKPDCDIPDMLWSLATCKPIDTRLDATHLHHHSLLGSCLELFQKNRTTLALMEFQNLKPLFTCECKNDKVCRFLRWSLKLLYDVEEREKLLNELTCIVLVHNACLCSLLFALACDGYKQKEFKWSSKLFELSIESVTSEDNCDLQGQKLEYLASCCHYNGLLVQAIEYQTKSIEAIFVSDVQVQLFAPSSSRNQLLVRRSERWVKYQLRLLQENDAPCECFPLFKTDLAMCRKYLSEIVVPIMVSSVGDTSKLMQPILKIVEGSELNNLEQIVRRLQTLASLESVEMKSKLRLLGDLIEALQNSDVKRYWQARLWKAICEHLCGALHRDTLTVIAANSHHLEALESQLLTCLQAIYFSIDQSRLLSQLSDQGLVGTCLMFLDKSKVFFCQGNVLAALKIALESLKRYDLIIRSNQRKKFTLSQSLGFSALTANLFLHLAMLYLVRPHPKECRYYCKQAIECCNHIDIKLAQSEQVLYDLENKCATNAFKKVDHVNSNNNTNANTNAWLDLQCLVEFQNLLSRSSLLATAAKQPLCSCVNPSSRHLQPNVVELRAGLLVLLESMVFNCDNMSYASAIDCLGFLSFITGNFEGLYQHLETQKSLLNLQFEQADMDDLCSAPKPAMLEGSRLFVELSERHTFSISLIYNQILETLVFWIVFYEPPKTSFRIPIPKDMWMEWCNELDQIDTLNKELLKRKDYTSPSPTSSSSLKREWWGKRASLDSRIKSLCATIHKFFSPLLCFPSQSAVKFVNLEKILDCSIATHHLPSYFSNGLIKMIFSSWNIQVDHAKAIIIDSESLAVALQNDLLGKDDFDNIFTIPSSSSNNLPRHVLLSASLNRFPWESVLDMPLLRLVPISSFCCPKSSGKDESDQIGFVINPSGDLIETERRFASKVLQSSDFVGILGRPPSEQEYAELLTSSRLFLYFGHGGGENYLSCSKVAKLQRVAPSLLLGCSSGKFRTQGEADPEGISIAYLKANVDYLVANLWDVTDKDIDAFASSVLDAVIEDDDKSNLAASVHDSRKVCNLKFINGAAPVVYTPYFMPINPI